MKNLTLMMVSMAVLLAPVSSFAFEEAKATPTGLVCSDKSLGKILPDDNQGDLTIKEKILNSDEA